MNKGHNLYGGLSAEHLKQFIERIERLEEEKQNITIDIGEVFKEAKGNGFDVKIMRQVLKLRKLEANELEEQEFLLDTYKRALGMVEQSDLFEQNEEKAKIDITVLGKTFKNVDLEKLDKYTKVASAKRQKD